MANQELHYQPSPLAGMMERFRGAAQVWLSEQHRLTRQAAVGAILTLALVAFELFNYDTTEFALENLLGTVSFVGVRWATILAIAFCSIDFAGLARLIAPDTAGRSEREEGALNPTYLLLGAWLLGGGMNAVMTWWAVSLALIGHTLGNEIVSREQLLRVVPIFVALLVWLTRLLIISSFVMNASQSWSRKSGRREEARQALRLRRKEQPAPVFVASATEDGRRTISQVKGKPARRPTMPRPVRSGRPAAQPMRARSGRSSDRML